MTQAGATSFAYDARGNLTGSGGDTYAYSSENRLTSGPGVTLSYDPLGRLYQTAGTGTTRFGYDGLDMIAEYNAANQLQRRYVHGPSTGSGGTDDPILWYEGAGTADKRYLLKDERGSVIAVTNASGAALTIDAYDEYGIPGADNMGRFQYTGQTWIPELGLYYYKARFYSPTLGRFLQTDPIGYGAGMNIYNYVGGDPVNYSDPLGLAGTGPTITVTARCSVGNQAVSDDRAKNGYRCVAIPRFNQEKLLNRDISGLGRVPQKEEPSIEMLFAHLKRILKMDRLRLRGPSGAKDEFHLAAAAQNLRKMAKMIPMPSTATA